MSNLFFLFSYKVFVDFILMNLMNHFVSIPVGHLCKAFVFLHFLFFLSVFNNNFYLFMFHSVLFKVFLSFTIDASSYVFLFLCSVCPYVSFFTVFSSMFFFPLWHLDMMSLCFFVCILMYFYLFFCLFMCLFYFLCLFLLFLHFVSLCVFVQVFSHVFASLHNHLFYFHVFRSHLYFYKSLCVFFSLWVFFNLLMCFFVSSCCFCLFMWLFSLFF